MGVDKMEQYFSFSIFSSTPCSIIIDDNSVYKIDNKHIYFATISSSSPTITIQAQQHNLTKHITVETIQTDGQYTPEYTIIKRNTFDYDVYLHFTSPSTGKKEVVFQHQDQDTSIVVTADTQYECCYYDHSIPCGYSYFDPCDEFNCNCIDHYYYLICSKPKYTFIIVIDLNIKKIIYQDQVSEYQFTNDTITLLHPVFDYYHHAKVTKFSTNGKQEYYVYTNNRIDEFLEDTLVPKVFLECLFCQDYEKATLLLSQDLQTTPEHLQQYFGSFTHVFYAGKQDDAICYTLQNDQIFKKYKFFMKNNRIFNISQS